MDLYSIAQTHTYPLTLLLAGKHNKRDSQNENQPSQATDMKLSCQFLQQKSACFVSNCTLANFPHHYHHERQQADRQAGRRYGNIIITKIMLFPRTEHPVIVC